MSALKRCLVWLIALIVGCMLVGLPLPKVVRAQGADFDPDLTRRATVQIMQVFTNALGRTVITCLGSGTLVSADGLILTNAHIALPIGGCQSDRLIVALTLRLEEAPVPTYYAEVVNYNIGWNLAVLRITDTIDDLPVNREALSLPFVELGSSEEVRLDSTLSFVGYAAPERDPAADSVSQVIRGTVSGFTAEARVGDRAWIKTRAAIPGTMSGGGAYDLEGRLVGVPTVEPVSSGGTGSEQPECRRIQDSNGDGRVDDRDVCIPESGFVNAIRPSRLARSLILAARLGIRATAQQETALNLRTRGTPTFSRLLFSTGVDPSGMPTSVIRSVPTGITRLYLFFDYSQMSDGMIYELRVLRDGLLDPTFSLAPSTWSGGESGLWYIGSAAQVYPNGEYEYILFIEGVRVANASIIVGGSASGGAEFSNIIFGVLSLENTLVSAGNVLPVSATINAEFAFNNLSEGQVWRQVWYYDGVPLAGVEGTWTGGSNGKYSVNASGTAENPLQPGRYRLELYIGDNLSATSDFVMAGGQVAYDAEIFSNLTFASEMAQEPGGIIGVTFPENLIDLYAVFSWRDIVTNTPITWRWSVDDNLLFEVTQPWLGDLSGSSAWLRLSVPGGVLPSGTYKIELLIGTAVEATASARVGLGQLPVEIFTVSEGVAFRGRLIDAETKEGVRGAAVIILKPDFDVRDFTWQSIEVFDLTFTDSEGHFLLPKRLTRDEFYSVIVIAKGYLPLSTDGLEVKATDTVIEVSWELSRD